MSSVRMLLCFAIVALSTSIGLGQSQASSNAVGYLTAVSDQCQQTIDVYDDADSACNHFAARGEIHSANSSPTPPMDEISASVDCFGITCITAHFKATGNNWGGWYFMNGVLGSTDRQPIPNWGTLANAGYDLSGATSLQFWARGQTGKEVIEFFAFGVGRDADSGNPTAPYPDSAHKVSAGLKTLSTSWTQYTIPLTGLDLQYVLGGFGWVAAAANQANTQQSITFYLDNIQFVKARPADPRFMVSYETIKSGNAFDAVERNASFVYDNAVALIALIGAGDLDRARAIADAMLYAQANDRFFTDGRVRNAYQGGDLILPPGWLPNNKAGTVRMPGWYDAGRTQWFEDESQVSTNTGNVAWTMLALLDFYETTHEQKYLTAVDKLGSWVINNTWDKRGKGGFTGGFDGWENGAVAGSSGVCASGEFLHGQCKRLYKSSEHNIDLYSCFSRLYLIESSPRWLQAAQHAKAFFLTMWDKDEGKFWTGTEEDGVTTSTGVIPVDIQAWSIEALGGEAGPYLRALNYVETHHKTSLGYGFKQDGGNTQCGDKTWFEGTAQVAEAYLLSGNSAKWKSILYDIHHAQFKTGAVPATDGSCLNTGFNLDDNQPWLYYHRAHVGATAWLSLAESGINPFRSDLYSPQPPAFTPQPGIFPKAQMIAMTAPVGNIYYTLDGTTPNTSSALYTAPIPVSVSLTIKAIAITAQGAKSPVVSALYVIEPPAATPLFSIGGGEYATPLKLIITDSTPGAILYYTTDGTTPTVNSMQYSGPLMISSTETVRAIAKSAHTMQSAIASATYTINTTPGNHLIFTAGPAAYIEQGGSAGNIVVSVVDGSGQIIASSADMITLRGRGPANSSVSCVKTASAGVVSFGRTCSPVLSATGTYTYAATSGGPAGAAATSLVLPNAYHFPATAVGASSNILTATLAFGSQTALGSIKVVTQGTEGLDFKQAATNAGSCRVGKTYSIGQSCTVNIVFSPTGAGVRLGAVMLSDSSATPNLLVSAFLSGTGEAALMRFSATQTVVGSGVSLADGVAVDAAGNVYIVDNYTPISHVIKVAAGGGPQTIVGTGLIRPTDVAVDGAGNVYIAQDGTLIKVAAGGGTETSIGTEVESSSGVAVDGKGNVYIADYPNNRVVKVPSDGEAHTVLGSGLIWPTGVAVDTTGNVYIADWGNGRIVKIAANSGIQTTLYDGGFLASSPYRVAVDGAGNVYFTDTLTHRVLQILADGEVEPTLFTGVPSPAGITLDGSGNMYVTDGTPESSTPVVKLVQAQVPTTVNLGNATVGGTSAKASLSFTNIGNVALTLNVAATPAQYSESNTCGNSVTINSSCTLNLSFAPTTGTHSPGMTVPGTLVLTDNSLSPAQSIGLTAQAIEVSASTPGFSPKSGTYTGMQSVTITDSTAGATIYYTTDGTTPTTSSTVYSQPIIVQTSETLKAMAVAPGYLSSRVASASYNIVGTQPSVTLNAPAAGATQISGHAYNVDPNTTKVVIYALTNEFYVQPLIDAPYTNINSDGSWSSSTNGWDSLVVILVNPSTYTPAPTKITNPAFDPGVLAWTEYPSTPASVSFGGRNWGIKVTGNVAGHQFDPGPNYWSNDPSVVHVADDGLHLKNTEISGRWQSGEVYLLQSLGYGTYTVQVSSYLDQLDLNTVAAPLFIYAAPGQELDNEYSGSGGLIPGPNSAQFVVQPYTTPGNLVRYVQPHTAQFTSQMEWRADHVTFTTWNGWSTTPSAGDVISQWTYTGGNIPSPGQERVHINLWLNNGSAPVKGTGDEMIIRSFAFQP